MKLLITQSSYIPWKGYFDNINSVDEFVIYDDAQYTRRDWRNRNRIKTARGPSWLTIPVEVKGKRRQRVRETKIADRKWAYRHWEAIRHAYGKAPCFVEYAPLLEDLYARAEDLAYLSEVNALFLDEICSLLGIEVRVRWSSEFELAEGKTERLVKICAQAGATDYYTGPSAAAYLDEERFKRQGIAVHYFDYSGYPEYPQLHPPFTHFVSVFDLILNQGAQALRCMKSFGDGKDQQDTSGSRTVLRR